MHLPERVPICRVHFVLPVHGFQQFAMKGQKHEMGKFAMVHTCLAMSFASM